MRSALYYPHTEIVTERMFKSSLLMWDNVECIVPGDWYSSDYANNANNYVDVSLIEEAAELIVKERSAKDSEKQIFHETVAEMINRGIPKTFKYSPRRVDQNNDYQIWASKIDNETWRLLEENGMTSGELDNGDYPLSRAAGLSMMAIMADVLAGKTRARVTDQGVAFAKLINDSVGTTPVSVNEPDAYSSIPFKFKTVDLNSVDLSKLIELRKCEAGADGSEYRKMRHNFCDAMVNHVNAISAPDLSITDITEIERIFVEEMDDKFKELRSRLGKSSRDFWISGELVTTIIATGSVLAVASNPNLATSVPFPEALQSAGSIVSLGGLLRAGYKYYDSRTSVMKENPMAYLYQAR